MCLKDGFACLFIQCLSSSDWMCDSVYVCTLMCLLVPCMSINVMLQRWRACDITDQTVAFREKEATLGSRAIWKMHVTTMFTQSLRSAIPHSAAPLLSFIVPSLFSHLLFHYFLFFPFLCLSPFLSLSITHSIISPLLCITPWLSLAQIFGPSLRHCHGTMQGSLVA